MSLELLGSWVYRNRRIACNCRGTMTFKGPSGKRKEVAGAITQNQHEFVIVPQFKVRMQRYVIIDIVSRRFSCGIQSRTSFVRISCRNISERRENSHLKNKNFFFKSFTLWVLLYHIFIFILSEKKYIKIPTGIHISTWTPSHNFKLSLSIFLLLLYFNYFSYSIYKLRISFLSIMIELNRRI